MKLVLAALLALGLSGTATAASKSNSLSLGAKAPKANVQMKSVDGRSMSVASAAGPKGTVVFFTCNHCPWAKLWQTRIAELGNSAMASGVGAIAINSNDPAAYPEDDFPEMQARAELLGLKFPYAVDATSEVAKAFGAMKTPEAFLFDAKGRLVYHGTIDDNAREAGAVKQPWLRQAIDAVVAGQRVRTAETKALGCSIKFRTKS